MALYHFSVKPISRGDGKSSVAAAAYRSAEKLDDYRYGKIQDYTNKTGVEISQIYAPTYANQKLLNRNELWNTVEKFENRKDACLAREFEIAFPSELNQIQRKKMLDDLCSMLVQKYNVIVDASIHAPHIANGSDERNFHAHIMFTTRSIDSDTGNFATKKYRDFNKELGSVTVKEWRKDFAELTNKHLANAGYDIQVDHRSYQEQGLEKIPTQHEGPSITVARRKYEKEQLKSIEDRNHKMILPDIAQKNDAIALHNLNLEIIATEQLIKMMRRETKPSFDDLINSVKNKENENNLKKVEENPFFLTSEHRKKNLFDNLDVGISNLNKSNLFSEFDNKINRIKEIEEEHRLAELRIQEQAEYQESLFRKAQVAAESKRQAELKAQEEAQQEARPVKSHSRGDDFSPF